MRVFIAASFWRSQYKHSDISDLINLIVSNTMNTA